MELKGYLKPIILRLLTREGKKTGSELAEEIEDLSGSRPSYGSIYPILQKMQEKNLVEVEEERKEKRYSLSKRGEELVEELKEGKREQTESFLNMLRTFKIIFDDEEIEILIDSIEKRRSQEGPYFPELLQIHHLLLTRDLGGNEEKIRTTLEGALKNLKEVLED